jgi:hypothetical protein
MSPAANSSSTGFMNLKPWKGKGYRLIAPSCPYGGYPTAGEAITPTAWLWFGGKWVTLMAAVSRFEGAVERWRCGTRQF